MRQPKPAGCRGCPLEHVSSHYVPDEVLPDSTVFVLGQNPGATEEAEGKPFVGVTGQTMETVFFPLAGLTRGENVSIGNVFRCRLGNTNDVPNAATLQTASEHCWRAHGAIPPSTKLVVSQGAVAWNFTQSRPDLAISDWRGHLGPNLFHSVPVYAVLHLADLAPNRNPRMTIPTQLDWQRIPSIVSGAWPLPLPPRLIVGENSFNEVEEWFTEAHEKAPYLAWDTEYIFDEKNPQHPDNYTLTMVSCAYPGMERGVQVLWMGGDACSWERAKFRDLFYALALAKPHVGHNFCAEMRSTQKTWGWDPAKFWGRFDDTMLAHAVLWSEWPHTLAFIESMHSKYRKIKHLPTTDPLRNWGDSVLTMVAWEDLKEDLANDPDTERIYREQSLRLVPIKYRREIMGIPVNKPRVEPAILSYRNKLVTAERIAQAYVGWPINLNSDKQLGSWLYDLENEPVQRSKNKKTKAKRSIDADAIATLRARHLSFDAEWETNNAVTEEYILQRIENGGHPLLESRVLFSESEQILAHYLEPLVIGGEA